VGGTVIPSSEKPELLGLLVSVTNLVNVKASAAPWAVIVRAAQLFARENCQNCGAQKDVPEA
jgi:hypothetical protein